MRAPESHPTLRAMKTIFHDAHHRSLVDRVARLPPDAPGRWGRMSAPQAVCHLNDAFRIVLGELPTRVRADTLFNRTVGRLFALTLPVPWPKGVPTAPEADQEKKGTPPGAFDRDCRELVELMDRFRATRGRGLDPHVALGRLTPGEWGRWGYRHVDHHLRQFGA